MQRLRASHLPVIITAVSSVAFFAIYILSSLKFRADEPPVRISVETVNDIVYSEGLDPDVYSNSCGYFAVAACARMMGLNVEPETLWSNLSWTQGGLSMFELKRVLQSDFNLQATGVELDTESLKVMESPIILWIEGGKSELYHRSHFLVYAGYSTATSRYSIIDPIRGATSFSSSQLTNIWDGVSLLVREAPYSQGDTGN